MCNRWNDSHLAQSITISRSGSLPSNQGDARYFTGSVRIDSLFSAAEPSRVSGARVTLRPGAYRLAYPPAGPDAACDCGHWLGPAVGRARRGDEGRRCGPHPTRCKALAWRNSHHAHDTYCHSGAAQRQSRRLDGESQRRAVPATMSNDIQEHGREICEEQFFTAQVTCALRSDLRRRLWSRPMPL